MFLFAYIFKALCQQSFTYTVDPSLFTTLSGDLLSRELGFVSEVASNAFDAITKAETQGKIQMKIDGNRFSIRDNGIGMDDKDIVKFIGSVGGSSSRTDEKKNLIGRFGMGFYSLFKYADLVEIFTKKKDGKGFKSSLQRTNNTFVVEECDLDFQGTEIVGYLNEEMKLTEKDLEEWVSNNLIHTGDNHSVVLIKSDEELENERNRVIEEYNKRKEEKIKRAEEKAAKREEAKQKAAEKAAEKEAAREAAKEAGEEEPVEEVEETEEPVEEEEEETEEEDLESLLAKITPTKDLSFAPWTNHDDMQIFKDIHKNRYNATSNLKYGQKTNFNVLQKKNNGREVSTRFDAIILIPELNMMSEPADGNIEIFVSGTKITDPNFKLPSSLKFVSAIIKSNDALITSTREGFYDSENTCKNIVNAIQKKIRDLFIQKTDEEIHAYNKIIKRTYLDNIQSANVSVAEKFAALLTFETNAAVKSIHKLSVEIEEMNNETKEKGLKPIDSIYYTNTLISLVKETESPLFDGIEVPYIFLNDIHDEEIVKALKSYGGMPLVNISTAKFENKTVAKEQEEEFKGILETIKNVLSPFVSDVFVSKRLVKLPFSIMAQKNSMTSAYKNVVGENELEKHPFRQYIDPKPVLEVNLDSKEIIALKNNMNEGAIFNMFLAASIACRLDVYSKAKCVNMLMNNARESLDVEKTKYEEKKEENSFDWMNKMPNMDDMMKDNEGLNDEDLSEVSDKENEDFNMDSNDLADKENEEVNKDVNDLNEKYLNDLAEKDLNEVSGKENEDVNMDINEVSDKDLNEVYDKENEEVSDDLFDDKDMSDDDKENETNDESMKDMFSGDKMKDMFSGDMMQKMKEMFKDDESMKDLFSDEKMKEMEDMFKGDGMKNMFNNDKMKEMFNNENMPGNDSVREDL